MRYKDSDRSISKIASELGVDFILEGSVRQVGDLVKITAQLINASEDQQIWAEIYDRDLDHIFEIQSEVALKIAKALNQEISPESSLDIRKKPTQNIKKYKLS